MLTPTEFETQFETQFETSEKDVLSDVLLKSSSELCVRYQGAEVFARLTLECMFGAQEWKYPVWSFLMCYTLAEQRSSSSRAGRLADELFTTPCA